MRLNVLGWLATLIGAYGDSRFVAVQIQIEDEHTVLFQTRGSLPAVELLRTALENNGGKKKRGRPRKTQD